MAVKKLKLPDNSSQDIHDARITGVDSTPTASSTNVVTSGGVATAISNIEHFYFVQGTSSHAGSSTSGAYLSTKWEGAIAGITTPTNGLKIAYRIATNPGVSSGGVVLSINGTTGPYYPVVIQKNTMVTTHYPVGSTFLAVFNSTQTATAYLTAGTKSTVTGCWQIMEYDSNTNTYQREYVSSDNTEYAITARYNTSTGETYYAEYGRYSEGVTLNPSTNTITASKFKVSGGTSSQFLKADGSTDSNTYLTSFTETDPTVPSWAKASSKPSYNFSEIGSTPSTISGYGITDAKIESGTITLGSNTITPLTSFTETDPIFSASAAAGISSSDITGWDNKVSNVQADWNATTGLAVILNKPSIPSAPGTLVSNNTTAQTASASEALSGTINLHKVSKTGTYSDLIGTPTIPDTSTVAGWGYVKYQLCADEAAYNAITTKDSGTLYLIPES